MSAWCACAASATASSSESWIASTSSTKDASTAGSAAVTSLARSAGHRCWWTGARDTWRGVSGCAWGGEVEDLTEEGGSLTPLVD
ncbi:hypothetical protein LINPERPRIM_LOCUS28453 [Linum perenne]